MFAALLALVLFGQTNAEINATIKTLEAKNIGVGVIGNRPLPAERKLWNFSVVVSNDRVTAGDLKDLYNLPGIKEVTLISLKRDTFNEKLDIMLSAGAIEKLVMQGGCDGESLRRAAKVATLRHLESISEHYKDPDLMHLYKLEKIERINIYGKQLTEPGMRELHKALPACSIRNPFGSGDFKEK